MKLPIILLCAISGGLGAGFCSLGLAFGRIPLSVCGVGLLASLALIVTAYVLLFHRKAQ